MAAYNPALKYFETVYPVTPESAKTTSNIIGCFDENPKAEYGLGLLYQSGNRVNGLKKEELIPEMFKSFMTAGDKGFIPAWNKLGELYRDGIGVDKDLNKAEEYFLKAARTDYAPACMNLVKFYHSQNKVSDAEKYLKIALLLNEPEARFLFDSLQENCDSGTKEYLKGKHEKAVQIWTENSASDELAQYKLAMNYIYGFTGKKQLGAGMKMLFDLSVKNNIPAKRELGFRYLDEGNLQKAYESFNDAGKSGDRISQIQAAGLIIKKELPGQINEAQEKQVAELAAESNAEALFLLGELYYTMKSGTLNKAKAFAYYQKASQLNHMRALYRLGECYYKGIGTSIDKGEASKCWQRYRDLDNRENMKNMIYLPLD